MGYYDQDYQNPNQKQKGNKVGYFLTSLLGAVLGAGLVIAATNLDVLPNAIQQDEQNVSSNGANNIATEKVSLNVESDVTKAVEKAGDAVVGITNIQSVNFWGQNGTADEQAGTGSGVIYKKAGNKAFVVTNHHVIEGANKIEVTLADGTKIPAKLLGSDIWTDLAVLEVDAKDVKTIAEIGDSDTLKPGEPVIAIGNPLGTTFSGSVTKGIISGLERAIPIDINQDGVADWNSEVLQTDAAINPGNSGGALVNIKGQLIGINSMKIAQSAVEGIGLAIPINSALPVIDDLEKFGEVKRPYMGVGLFSVNEVAKYHQQETLKLPEEIDYGVVLSEVEPNAPAAQAGLKELDVIVEMDGEKINDIVDLRKHLYTKKKIGEKLEVKFYRDGKLQKATMELTGETF